jgi:hypothetical protein
MGESARRIVDRVEADGRRRADRQPGRLSPMRAMPPDLRALRLSNAIGILEGGTYLKLAASRNSSIGGPRLERLPPPREVEPIARHARDLIPSERCSIASVSRSC